MLFKNINSAPKNVEWATSNVKASKHSTTWRVLLAVLIVMGVKGLAIALTSTWQSCLPGLAEFLSHQTALLIIAVCAVVWLLESRERSQQRQFTAWLVIQAGQGNLGDSGRTQAFAYLNKEGADLRGLTAPRADLQGLNLKHARLIAADLPKTCLEQSNLRGANLHGANLAGAALSEANFDRADLTKANLQGADMPSASFKAVNLPEANLEGANLRDVNLQGANLHGAPSSLAFQSRASRRSA
ncbi:MAG: pentapeptide repeat-containing protein [Cyanobacteria bacterium J06636_16]